MKRHRIGYIRISTLDQNTERQLDGLELDKIFTDNALGKNADRPQLDELLSFVREFGISRDTVYQYYKRVVSKSG